MNLPTRATRAVYDFCAFFASPHRLVYIPFRRLLPSPSDRHDRISGNRLRPRQHRVHQVRVPAAWCSAGFSLRLYRYWGKRDTKLIIPTNSSLSVTLDQDHLRSTTTSRADPSFEKDRLWLNGIEEPIAEVGRTATCIREMKRLRAEVEAQSPNAPKVRFTYSIQQHRG